MTKEILTENTSSEESLSNPHNDKLSFVLQEVVIQKRNWDVPFFWGYYATSTISTDIDGLVIDLDIAFHDITIKWNEVFELRDDSVDSGKFSMKFNLKGETIYWRFVIPRRKYPEQILKLKDLFAHLPNKVRYSKCPVCNCLPDNTGKCTNCNKDTDQLSKKANRKSGLIEFSIGLVVFLSAIAIRLKSYTSTEDDSIHTLINGIAILGGLFPMIDGVRKLIQNR